MHIFCVYRYPGDLNRFASIIVVKDGFLWKALFFSILWAIFNKLWPIIIGSFLFFCFLIGFGIVLRLEGIEFLDIFLWGSAFLGVFAADLQGWCLEKKGFKNVSLISAANHEIALKKYLVRESIVTHTGVVIA